MSGPLNKGSWHVMVTAMFEPAFSWPSSTELPGIVPVMVVSTCSFVLATIPKRHKKSKTIEKLLIMIRIIILLSSLFIITKSRFEKTEQQQESQQLFLE